MIKALVLDLNGVILKSEYLTDRIKEKWNIPVEKSLEVLKKSMNQVRLNPNIKVFTFWGKLFQKYNIDITEEEFLKFWFSGETLDRNLFEYIKELREKRVKVYVFSNNFKERTEYYRKNIPELFENIDGSFFSWETGFVKSDIKAYENLLKNINVKSEEIVYFEDSKENLDMAKTLGINGYLYEGIESIKRYL